MLISDLGEFGLIERIRSLVGEGGADVLLGIGDDVAVLQTTEGRRLLVTCDAQVEGVHFLRDRITPYQLGRKAVAINVSDIAAKGGYPRNILVSLTLPGDLSVDFVDDLYRGMRDEGSKVGATIVGGNMARSLDGVVIDITLMGEVEIDRLVVRSGALLGDRVLVTGSLGQSAAGLALISHPEVKMAKEQAEIVVASHLMPEPRLKEGRLIGELKLATAMMDVSDGLAADSGHICEASKVGIKIDAQRLPISGATRAVAAQFNQDPLTWALFGGEDYELLLTVPPDRVSHLISMVKSVTGSAVTDIGEIIPASEGRILVLPIGDVVPLTEGGWDHFRASS